VEYFISRDINKARGTGNVIVVAERDSPEAMSKVGNIVCSPVECRGRNYNQGT
jgi:hypothetical protein